MEKNDKMEDMIKNEDKQEERRRTWGNKILSVSSPKL